MSPLQKSDKGLQPVLGTLLTDWTKKYRGFFSSAYTQGEELPPDCKYKSAINPEEAQQPFLESFTWSVSQTQFAAFQRADTPCEGLPRYLWNIALCEALYPAFHTLEIAFRNAIHRELGATLQSPEWLQNYHPSLKLKEIAITQMRTLLSANSIKRLK